MADFCENLLSAVPDCKDHNGIVINNITTTPSSFTAYDYNQSGVNLCDENNEDEQVLDSKIIDVNVCCDSGLKTSDNIKVNGDGSDSGVEFGSNVLNSNAICGLQRALSSNSGGYSSSCGGLEEAVGMISCDSSLISYCSDMCDNIKPIKLKSDSGGCDGTSEGGSESSSVTGGPVTIIRSKKKVGVTEPTSKTVKRYSNESNASSKGRSSSVNRVTPTKPNLLNLATRERARSRDKVPQPQKIPSSRATPPKSARPPKPDSFPVDIKDPASPAIQRIRGSRTPSVPRGRTSGSTPTDDGRWPSIGAKGGACTPKSSRGLGIMTESLTVKTRAGAMVLESISKSNTFEKYATLPRRRKEKSADDLKMHSPRSSSITRDNPRGSTATLKKQVSLCATTPSKFLPPYPKLMTPTSIKKHSPKTKIYHETAVQTAITSQDVEDAFSGVVKQVLIDACETIEKSCQSDIRDKEIDKLEEQVKKLKRDFSNIQSTLTEKSLKMAQMEQDLIQEREDKLAAQKELHANSERVLAMLESVHIPAITTTDASGTGGGDSLLILESQIIKSEHTLEKQEAEIVKWKNICSRLQNDMEKSLRTQRNLIEQREMIEHESTELQDFLQTEKATLTDSLREIERDVDSYRQRIVKKDSDLERLQEECRHLVRISEQRRQETLGLQSKYAALEGRSREMLMQLQQGQTVSGVTCALSGLGARIDSLVEQLIASYNISDQELEDAVYHNEAFTNSGGSEEGSPESEEPFNFRNNPSSTGALSPQRGHSFIAAVINAIKNATTSTKMITSYRKVTATTTVTANVSKADDDSDATEMLDSETEPCLMMENVLEDVTLPDSHSHNMVSSVGGGGLSLSQVEMPSDMKQHGGDSLYNLSQAIENRQQIELQSSFLANRSVQHHANDMLRQQSEQSTSDDVSVHESVAEIPSIVDYCSAQGIVDQVIDVDNSITKLLKVLRIIQTDNDNCIQQLIMDKNKLQLTKEEMYEQIRECDGINYKLREELKEASQTIISRGNELTQNRAELQKHRVEIDRLNEDICNLSTLCSQNMSNKEMPANSRSKIKNDAVAVLKSWETNNSEPTPEIINHVINACNEIPILKEQLSKKERLINDMTNNLSNTKNLMTSSFHNAVSEAKRQYDAIDRALETLNSIQSIVHKCPALAQLQRDLEETNFQSATSLPIATALLTSSTSSSNSGCLHDGVVHKNDDNSSSNEDLNANGNANNIEETNNSNQQQQPIDSTA